LAAFSAPKLNKEERKSQAKKQRQACKDKQSIENEIYLQRPRQLSGARRIRCLSRQISSSGSVQKIGREYQHAKVEVNIIVCLRTSSEELVD
jgi:hypothetical protein